MYQQYPPAVGLGHYGAHSQQRATTPPLNTLGGPPHRTAPTTPPMMSHFQQAPPPPHAVSMSHEQHGPTYVNPQTVAMRHAPPSPTMQPFMVNPFNSRPASPTKLEGSLDVPYAAHQHQQQLQSNGMERFGSVAPFRGTSVHPEPSIYRDAPSRLPSQQHPSFVAPHAAANYAAHDASSMPQNHRGVSLAMPALMPATFQQAAPSSFGMMGSNPSAAADIASAAMAHYQQRLEERRQHEHKLAQEEAALAAEEAALLAQLQQTEVERRQIDDEHQSLCAGWANIFSQNQWYDETPFLDVSAEVADVHYRCQALEHHLGELRLVLEGHHTELRKYESNEQVRERQRASMRKLEECLDEMERRRHGYRMTSEAHFDAEAQRERACRSYLTEVSVRTKDLESQLMELGASVPSSVATQPPIAAAPQWAAPGSQPTSRAGSVMSSAHMNSSSAGLMTLPLNSHRHYSGAANASCAPAPPRGGLQEQQPSSLPATSSVIPFRQRIVSFRSPSDHSNPATGGSGHFTATAAGGSATSDVDGASFTVALDEESFYSAAGTNGRSQEMDDDLGGLNGGSFAMNLCDTKRRRTDFPLTAM